MIQRIQSIFLLAVATLMTGFLFLPIWKSVAGDTTITMEAMSVIYQKSASEQPEIVPTYLIGLLAILSIVIAFFSISQFKKRMLQIKLNALNSVVLAGIVAATVFYANNYSEQAGIESNDTFLLGFYLPIAAIIFNILASRYIKKDEKLIKSMDRLR